MNHKYRIIYLFIYIFNLNRNICFVYCNWFWLIKFEVLFDFREFPSQNQQSQTVIGSAGIPSLPPSQEDSCFASWMIFSSLDVIARAENSRQVPHSTVVKSRVVEVEVRIFAQNTRCLNVPNGNLIFCWTGRRGSTEGINKKRFMGMAPAIQVVLTTNAQAGCIYIRDYDTYSQWHERKQSQKCDKVWQANTLMKFHF